MDNKYKDIQVIKPWGREYLAYQNKDVALWVLHLNRGQSTSMHCHPTKTTGLVCFNGEIEVGFLADYKILYGVNSYYLCDSKVMIRRGLFHKSIARRKSTIFEIESPNNKEDLLRLKDKYGRKRKGYETSYVKKDEDCLWIEDPKPGESKVYKYMGQTLLVEHITDIKEINKKNNEDLIMLLSGGLYQKNDNKKLISTQAGDVGYAKIMKQVAKEMDGVMPKTIIMTMKYE